MLRTSSTVPSYIVKRCCCSKFVVFDRLVFRFYFLLCNGIVSRNRKHTPSFSGFQPQRGVISYTEDVHNVIPDLDSKGIVHNETIQSPRKEVAWSDPIHISSLELWCVHHQCTLMHNAAVVYPFSSHE